MRARTNRASRLNAASPSTPRTLVAASLGMPAAAWMTGTHRSDTVSTLGW